MASVSILFILLCLLNFNFLCAQDKADIEVLDAGESTTDEYSDEVTNSPVAVNKEEKDEVSLSLAEHLRKDPQILQFFKPSALKNVVNNPKSLSILPRKVLDEIINDPIFSVTLPVSSLQKITKLLSVMSDSNELDEEDYDYDIDLGDSSDTVTSFIGDLSPEFLKGIDPDIIVEYFENASPTDLKAILNNSSIIASLPAETIGSLLGKLNQDLLLQLLQSSAVSDLYNSTTVNLTQIEQEKFKVWQIDVASHIVNQVDASVLTALPEFIVRSQLSNMKALSALLNNPSKLEALVERYGTLLDEISPETVVGLARQDKTLLGKIPTKVFIKLATCDVVRGLSAEFSASQLVSNMTDKFVELLLNKPEIIDCVSEVNLPDFVRRGFQDAVQLDLKDPQKKKDETLNKLTRSLLSVPEEILIKLAGNMEIQEVLPDMVIVQMINQKPKLVSMLPKNVILKIAKSKPWLTGMFSMTAVLMFAQRQDVFMALSDRDLANLLAFQPGILSVLATMPTDVVVVFLTGHLDLLDMIPASAKGILKRVMQQKELLRAIPIELHVKLARKKIVQEIVDKYTLLDILEAHPTLIARVDPELIGPYLRFLEDPWFKERLPCATVRAATNHPTLLSLIPDRNLAQIITCRHIVSCIEKKELERLLAVSNLGSRLKLSTLMVTASNLRLSQLSLRAALNFVTKQVPQSNSQLFFN